MPYVGFVISYKKVAQCFSFQIQNNSIQLVELVSGGLCLNLKENQSKKIQQLISLK